MNFLNDRLITNIKKNIKKIIFHIKKNIYTLKIDEKIINKNQKFVATKNFKENMQTLFFM